MKKAKLLINALFIFAALWLFSGCQKGCLSSTGKETTETREIENFRHIQLWDNIDLVIIQDTFNQLQLTAGENLLPNIKSTLTDGVLKLSNENKCNWLRSYSKPIEAVLHVKDLYELEIHGTGEIRSTNTIHSDSLMLNVWDAAGTLSLDIDTEKSTIRYHIGTLAIYYSGKTRLSYVSSNSYGPVDTRNLESQQTYISTIGSNNNYVWAIKILEATIGASGSIYYKEQPEILKTFINGSGEVAPIQP